VDVTVDSQSAVSHQLDRVLEVNHSEVCARDVESVVRSETE
jgi:hypothetical protein